MIYEWKNFNAKILLASLHFLLLKFHYGGYKMTAKQPKGTKTKGKTAFIVTGDFKKGGKIQKFTKEVLVINKQNAEEYIYSILGSKHRVKRREITITKIDELPLDKITDPVIKQIMGGK